MVGWKVTKTGEYLVKLPILSDEEELLLKKLEAKYREISRFGEKEAMEEIREVLKLVCEEENVSLDEDQERYLVDIAYRYIFGNLFLDDLLKDSKIEEIAIIGIGKPIYVYLSGEGWKKTNVMITSQELLIELINKIVAESGRRITLKSPRLDAMMNDGSRLHATIPPISKGEVTIRKFRKNPLSVKQILDFGTTSLDFVTTLSLLMQADVSLLVAGNTASGKTTTLNALFSFIPHFERIIITEETPEINIPHPHQVRLVENKEMGIYLKDLVYDTLRMRPDRIIVGEVRSKEEVQALFDVILSGQARGAYATFHAQSVQEAIKRIKSFGITEMDAQSLSAILIQRRLMFYDPRKRKTVESRKMTELGVFIKGKLQIIFSYDPLKDRWDFKHKDEFFNFLASKLMIKKGELMVLYGKRKEFLKNAPLQYVEFFQAYQREWFTSTS